MDENVEPRDEWVVGGNGTETPFLKNGRRYLYVWNPATGEHGFLDLETDIVVSDHEFYARDTGQSYSREGF